MRVPIITHLLIHSLTQKRNTRTADDQGGWIEALSTVGIVSGRIVPATAREMEVAAQRQASVTHAIYLPAATNVRINDHFTYDGRTFIVRVRNITPSVEVYKKALCEEVQSEG